MTAPTPNPTPENIRYHAAGHLAAAALCARKGMAAAARVILEDVGDYMDAVGKGCPDHLRQTLAKCIEDPTLSVNNIAGLERIFVDGLNTVIEQGRGGFGN